MAEEEKKTYDGPRLFMSKAFVMQLEPGLFGLFRSVLQEDPQTGQKEKVGKPLGPIRVLRPMNPGEEDLVRLKTVHPTTGESLALVEAEVDQPSSLRREPK